MSDLLALLHTNSPLSLIHRYLDIQTIDSAEILEKLQKTLVDIDDENERSTREKRRFFIFFNTLNKIGIRVAKFSKEEIDALIVNSIFFKILFFSSVRTEIFSADFCELDDVVLYVICIPRSRGVTFAFPFLGNGTFKNENSDISTWKHGNSMNVC
jgi:hypothetical protein